MSKRHLKYLKDTWEIPYLFQTFLYCLKKQVNNVQSLNLCSLLICRKRIYRKFLSSYDICVIDNRKSRTPRTIIFLLVFSLSRISPVPWISDSEFFLFGTSMVSKIDCIFAGFLSLLLVPATITWILIHLCDQDAEFLLSTHLIYQIQVTYNLKTQVYYKWYRIYCTRCSISCVRRKNVDDCTFYVANSYHLQHND